MPERRGDNSIIFNDYPDFRPNMAPKEMFQAGVFGGTYFRPIKSSVTKKEYKNVHAEFPNSWFAGVTVDDPKCDVSRNKYKVASGTSLRNWERKGWIKAQDPYGWVQWYCRFYKGRRTDDDKRQIGRWLGICGPEGRFRKRLYNMYKKAKVSSVTSEAKKSDPPVSPKIHQLLIQWAYIPNTKDYKAQFA
jgi:hypothetical protein